MYTSNTLNTHSLLKLQLNVYKRYRSGIITLPQAQQETALLQNLLKTLEATELQARIETLERKLDI
jgi:hypothetical protein